MDQKHLRGLIRALEYIEKARSWGINKGARHRMPKEKCADLFFAGAEIVGLVRKHGDDKTKEQMATIIERFEKS